MSLVALVIDPDESELRQLVRILRGAGFLVDGTRRSVDGLLHTLESSPDLIVLAAAVPPLEAEDLLAILRRLTRAPIIIVGSGGDPEEIDALEKGADSYLSRPFTEAVLLERAKALLRRYRNPVANQSLGHQAAGVQLLTPTEGRLLNCLLAHNGKAVSSSQLLLEAWGGEASYEALKFYLRRLRRKLPSLPTGMRLVSVRGMGHRVVSLAQSSPDTYLQRAG